MNNPHSYPRASFKRPPKEQLIMGVHAVREVLLHVPERLIQVFTEKPQKEGRKQELLNLCEEKGISCSFTSFAHLSHLVESESHQGVVAQIKARTFYDVRTFLEKVGQKTSLLVLMLDQIFDPQNFGALLRSAECFGADGVVWSKNRGSDLTPVAAKASSGASELLPLIRIANLAEAASQFQDQGFEIVTALADPSAESLFQFSFPPKTVLVVGSEGEGIQPLIRKRANRSLFIPLWGKIDSLNVAQATAVILSRFRNIG